LVITYPHDRFCNHRTLSRLARRFFHRHRLRPGDWHAHRQNATSTTQRGRPDAAVADAGSRLEPVVELHPPSGVLQKLDTESDFGEGHDAHVKKVEGLTGYKLQHLRVRSPTPQLRENVGVEQPARHSSTPRIGA
jgi:hypothetical protein